MEAQRLLQVAEVVRRAGLNAQTIAALRERFADIHFTHCLDEEVDDGEPAYRDPAFNVYLVDGRQHCLRLTSDLDAATGLLLAEAGVGDDEEMG